MNHFIVPSAITILLLCFFSTLRGQAPVTGITYSYDAAGNRIHRAPSTIAARKANPDVVSAEQKETTVIKENNIVVSFTPNPTATGNFAVAISRKDFSTAYTQNTLSDKPEIFVYNPLGELIQQKSAQYDNQVNIDLSALSKGIYLVKVQCGEEALLHRMAYQ